MKPSFFPEADIKIRSLQRRPDCNRCHNFRACPCAVSVPIAPSSKKTANVPGSNEYGSPSKNSDCRPDSASHSGKPFELLSPHTAPIGYVVSPYPHPHNGSLGPVSMVSPIHILHVVQLFVLISSTGKLSEGPIRGRMATGV
ncbi:hypothetical protein CEXT_451611 [Caerostris extrusa]|uniref:Uncharacterized protein n=1 Tax=Caerostris extrusa TaxID=172846 RepID=A0AAV4W513_CAEEX|nr:hypothetical protein CEXT_451611 [Caerostris extrusa]